MFWDTTAAKAALAGGKPKMLGMECLLKDGFVSYLRDFVKITPRIPK